MVCVLGEMTGLTSRDSPSSHCWVAFLQQHAAAQHDFSSRITTPRLQGCRYCGGLLQSCCSKVGFKSVTVPHSSHFGLQQESDS